MRLIIALILLFFAGQSLYSATAPLGSDPGTDPSPYQDSGQPWREGDVTIPELPRDGDLVDFGEVPGQRGLTLYLDRRSLSVGKEDRVARYTVVLESAAGARNVFYEGLRCAEGDFRRYAFASGERPFERLDDDRWVGLADGRPSPYREYLVGRVLCDPYRRPRSPREVVALAGRAPSIERLDY